MSTPAHPAGPFLDVPGAARLAFGPGHGPHWVIRPDSPVPLALAIADALGYALMTAPTLRVASIGAVVHVFSMTIMFFGGMFIPVTLFPHGVEIFTRFVPTPGRRGENTTLAGRGLGTAWSDGTLPWLLVHTALLIALGWLTYLSTLRRARREGGLSPQMIRFLTALGKRGAQRPVVRLVPAAAGPMELPLIVPFILLPGPMLGAGHQIAAGYINWTPNGTRISQLVIAFSPAMFFYFQAVTVTGGTPQAESRLTRHIATGSAPCAPPPKPSPGRQPARHRPTVADPAGRARPAWQVVLTGVAQ